MFLCCVTLLLTVHRLTTHSLVEIYLMAVKLGTIYAGEECLAANAHAARTAHSCAIYHQGVERYGSGERVLLGSERNELHHYHRANGYALVVLLALVVDQILDFGRYHTLETARAIVGSYVEVVGNLLHLLGIDQHRSALSADDNICVTTVLV